MTSKRVAVTGGYGFIGSAVVRALVAQGCEVLNIDVLTYAASPDRLSGVSITRLVTADVRDEGVEDPIVDFAPDVIVHLAAETHVTRSEVDPETFFSVNVGGTENLLNSARRAGSLFVHISTDEVYGSSSGHAFKEDEKRPGEGEATSAYARSKAMADDIARSAAHDQPVIVIRPTNCFGPWQHPEKAIPRWIIRALLDRPLPVWGDGGYVRDWMFVEDAASGITTIMDEGEPGLVYNLGPGDSSTDNLEIARAIARLAGRSEDLVTLTAYDRPDHDRMYCVDVSRVSSLGWEGSRDMHEGLRLTVDWYRDNDSWWRPLLAGAESLYDDAAVREP